MAYRRRRHREKKVLGSNGTGDSAQIPSRNSSSVIQGAQILGSSVPVGMNMQNEKDEEPNDAKPSNATEEPEETKAKGTIFTTELWEGDKLLLCTVKELPGDGLKRFLRSPNFKPYWDALWEDSLKHRKEGLGDLELKDVLDVMHAFEEDIVNPSTDTSEWVELHYLARFMYWVLRKNTKLADGLTWNCSLGLHKDTVLLWTLLKSVTHLHSPSQINRPWGGRALLNENFDPTAMFYKEVASAVQPIHGRHWREIPFVSRPNQAISSC